jgi:phosphoribosyl 1,2-cyclic phosphate phosphodiesterase
VANNENTIQFLGTGAGDFNGVYALGSDGKYHTEASEPDPRDIRQASALYLSPDTMIDLNSAAQLAIHSVREACVHKLLITHTHWDHFEPLAIHALAARLPHPLVVYGSISVQHALDFAAAYRWDDGAKAFVTHGETPGIQVQVLAPGEALTVDDTKITAVLANHMIDKLHLNLEQQALNYVIERDGRTLYYGVDSSTILPATFDLLSRFRFDIAIFDATFGDREIDPAGSGHRNFSMLDATIARFRQADLLKPGATVVAQHLYKGIRPHREVASRLSQKGITLAYDGWKIQF